MAHWCKIGFLLLVSAETATLCWCEPTPDAELLPGLEGVVKALAAHRALPAQRAGVSGIGPTLRKEDVWIAPDARAVIGPRHRVWGWLAVLRTVHAAHHVKGVSHSSDGSRSAG